MYELPEELVVETDERSPHASAIEEDGPRHVTFADH
jgi:hypothetical protein